MSTLHKPGIGPVDLTRCCHVRLPEGRCPDMVWGPYSFCRVHAQIGIAEGWLTKNFPVEIKP